MAIDATSAEKHDIALGSTIKVLFQGPTQEFTVVGTVGFGDEKDLGGTTSAYFDTGHRAAGARHARAPSTRSRSAPTSGVSQAELAKRLDRSVIPRAPRR